MNILFLYLWYAVNILFEWSNGEKKAKDLNMWAFLSFELMILIMDEKLQRKVHIKDRFIFIMN